MNKTIKLLTQQEKVNNHLLQVAFIQLAEKYFKPTTLRQIKTILELAITDTTSKYHKDIINILQKKKYALLPIKRELKRLQLDENYTSEIIYNTLYYFHNELLQSVHSKHLKYKMIRTKTDVKI